MAVLASSNGQRRTAWQNSLHRQEILPQTLQAQLVDAVNSPADERPLRERKLLPGDAEQDTAAPGVWGRLHQKVLELGLAAALCCYKRLGKLTM